MTGVAYAARRGGAVMTVFHFIGSQEQTFPTLHDAAGRVLVCKPGDTVELDEDPGTPWLVEDPTSEAAQATATSSAGPPVDDPENANHSKGAGVDPSAAGGSSVQSDGSDGPVTSTAKTSGTDGDPAPATGAQTTPGGSESAPEGNDSGSQPESATGAQDA